jgi:hypothetical protein
MCKPRIGCNPNRILQHLWKNFDKNKKVLAMFIIFLPSANLTLNKAYPAMIFFFVYFTATCKKMLNHMSLAGFFRIFCINKKLRYIHTTEEKY